MLIQWCDEEVEQKTVKEMGHFSFRFTVNGSKLLRV